MEDSSDSVTEVCSVSKSGKHFSAYPLPPKQSSIAQDSHYLGFSSPPSKLDEPSVDTKKILRKEDKNKVSKKSKSNRNSESSKKRERERDRKHSSEEESRRHKSRRHHHRHHHRERKHRRRSSSTSSSKSPRPHKHKHSHRDDSPINTPNKRLHERQKRGSFSSYSKPKSCAFPPRIKKIVEKSDVSPQETIRKTMENLVQKTQQETGIELPKYYNPIAVNPAKYAETLQKRKLLWQNSKKKKELESGAGVVTPSPSLPSRNATEEYWKHAQFSEKGDTAKFRKLMGIKGGENEEDKNVQLDEKEKQERDEMFKKLDAQYEVARISTHLHRGLGLGFSSYMEEKYS